METFNNNKIYEKVKENLRNAQRGSSSDPLEDFEINKTMMKYCDVRQKVFSNVEYIKVLLVLGLKEITWRKELEVKFDAHPSNITHFFEFMKQEGMVLFKPLVEVDEILFETVIKMNPISFYAQRDKVKVYTLSPEGKQITKKLMDDILKLTNERTDLQIIVDMIMQKTEQHRVTMQRIMQEETELLERNVSWPDGVMYRKETLKSKEISHIAKLVAQESKLEEVKEKTPKQLEMYNSNALALKEAKPLAKYNSLTNEQKRPHTRLSGVIVIDSEDQITKKDIVNLQKESQKEALTMFQHYHKQHQQSKLGTLFGKGYHNDGEIKAEALQPIEEDEGLAFLNSL